MLDTAPDNPWHHLATQVHDTDVRPPTFPGPPPPWTNTSHPPPPHLAPLLALLRDRGDLRRAASHSSQHTAIPPSTPPPRPPATAAPSSPKQAPDRVRAHRTPQSQQLALLETLGLGPWLSAAPEPQVPLLSHTTALRPGRHWPHQGGHQARGRVTLRSGQRSDTPAPQARPLPTTGTAVTPGGKPPLRLLRWVLPHGLSSTETPRDPKTQGGGAGASWSLPPPGVGTDAGVHPEFPLPTAEVPAPLGGEQGLLPETGTRCTCSEVMQPPWTHRLALSEGVLGPTSPQGTLQGSLLCPHRGRAAWTTPSHREKPAEWLQALRRPEGSCHLPRPTLVPPGDAQAPRPLMHCTTEAEPGGPSTLDSPRAPGGPGSPPQPGPIPRTSRCQEANLERRWKCQVRHAGVRGEERVWSGPCGEGLKPASRAQGPYKPQAHLPGGLCPSPGSTAFSFTNQRTAAPRPPAWGRGRGSASRGLLGAAHSRLS